ncbi:MAG TPA: hypothetical protein PLV83_03495 [Bacilli bacterium]|nr:hypothetical protein [Bacilli bacterium]
MKWYIYKDNGNGTYQLILDHNTTVTVAWNSSNKNKDGMKEVATALANDASAWDNSLKKNNVRLITANEVADITGASREDTLKWDSDKPYGTSINEQSSWFYFDGGKNINKTSYSETDGWQKQYANSTTKSEFYWLYDYVNDCIEKGCKIENNNGYGYWTSNAVTNINDLIWGINRTGSLDKDLITRNNFGLRPVITY